ncbi:hypothetical protein KAU45_03265 [bacterium]|nr:hypothetical protein [bacterium]
MRKLLLVLIAGLALILAGCTTGTNGDGNGQQKIDTQAFFPNDQDNYWQYELTGDQTGTVTQTIIDDPGYLLAGQQRIRNHYDDDPEGDYWDSTIIDDEEDSVEFIGIEIYQDDSREEWALWDDDPLTLLKWDDYGIDEGDNWDAWEVSGIPTWMFGIFPPEEIDSLGFDLVAEVADTVDFEYDKETLTAYLIEFTGDVTFEDGEVDPEDWEDYKFQIDYTFVPEFGWVMIQQYTNEFGSMVPTVLSTLIDTNVPIPD